MAGRIERVAELTCERAFLYEDPDSFRAGVREALRAIEAALPQSPRQEAPQTGSGPAEADRPTA